MSTKEGSVLNADDLKLAEMGYKPVQPPPPPPWQMADGRRNFRGGLV